MTTHREFVDHGGDGPTGVAFTGCHLLSATPAHAPAPAAGTATRRRDVVVNGRRVKTVDVHAHCSVPEAMALLGMKIPTPALLMSQPTDRLKAMDEQGIDVEALSINAYWYKADRDVAQKLIAMQNEKLAEFCAAHPERFVAFASVALQHPDLAAQQLEEAVKKYGLRGAAIGGSVNGEELADPKFHPFWAKVEQLGSRFKGSGGLDNVIGNPLETTIALSHLIFEGTLDQFPGLKICAAHGGGYLPSYAARSDAVHTTFPDRITTQTRKKPTEYLRQLYYDSIVFTSEALRHLVAETGPGHIVMGTDYPFPWTKTSVDHILNTPGLTDDERVAMLGGTAARLLGIKS
jgi:aminocarboxymuconate-semialdehyde decarboxylase